MTAPTAQLLGEWQTKLAIITNNVNDLFESADTLRIRSRLRDGFYTGLTHEAAGAAIDKLKALMADYRILARIVDAASEVGKTGFFESRERKDGREQRILELLEGNSVELPAVQVPLPMRDLLTDPNRQQKISPAELLRAMQSAFAEARDLLAMIDRAEMQWLSQTEQLRDEHGALMRLAAELDPNAASRPVPAPTLVATDPLETQSTIDAIAHELAAWRQAMVALEQDRRAASSMLEAAARGVDELSTLRQSHSRLVDESQRLLGEPDAAVAGSASDEMEDFSRWLGKLRDAHAQRHWHAVKTGCVNLEKALRSALESLRARHDGLREKLEEVAELKGRFKALRMKAAALRDNLAARGPVIDRLETEIASGFKARPIPLDAQRQRISHYATELHEVSRPRAAS